MIEGEEDILCVDNKAATQILVQESGSWRTRHLRVRAAGLKQRIEAGKQRVEHIPGRSMLADLNRKSHPFARLDHLRRLWGIREVEETKSEVNKIKVKMMRAFLPLIPEDSESPESSPKGNDQPPVQREVEETPGTSSQGKSVNKQPKAVESGFEDEITALSKKEDAIRNMVNKAEEGHEMKKDCLS